MTVHLKKLYVIIYKET